MSTAGRTPFRTLISAEELAHIIDDTVIFDCRHDLTKPEYGRNAYAEGHLPSARFMSMDEDLSRHAGPEEGRHPLPDRDTLRRKLAAAGVREDRQVVAYDAQGGMPSSRLWWLLRWLGHDNVAVLDGGIEAWKTAGYPVTKDVPAARTETQPLPERAAAMPTVDTATIRAEIGRPDARRIVDARAGERYRGEVEPLDRVAGHIPGAVNRPFGQNLRPDGRFKPEPVLRQEFEQLLEGRAPQQLIHQCGSGVSACHNLLAMAHAGLDGASLYPGSWSAWSSDPANPVATGPAA